MPKKGSSGHEADRLLLFNPMSTEFATMGKKRIEDFCQRSD